MSRLLKRLQQLESKFTDRQGLISHSPEWFSYWDAKIDHVIAGEQVDLSGMTLEYIDAMIARGKEAPEDEDPTILRASRNHGSRHHNRAAPERASS